MIRQSLLPYACIALALAFAGAPAAGQDRPAQERLDRLERDLNMLQRQVYRGGPPPMAGMPGMPDRNVAVGIEIRMDRIETQMRDLTGRVEEFMNQVEQLRHRLEQINSDLDVRMSQAGAAGAGSAALAPPAAARTRTAGGPPPGSSRPPPEQSGGTLRPPGTAQSLYPPGAAAPPPPGPPPPGAPPRGPEPVFGYLTPPSGNPPRGAPDSPSAENPPGALPPGALPPGSAGEQYKYAFELVKQADYPAAEAALRSFVEQHPTDTLAGTAQYWLGETYYTRHQYMDAATAFAEGYKRYPKSSKAPDMLYKLGMSLERANQKQNACIAFVKLETDFPTMGAAIRDRAAAEKKKLGC